ncbi:MAG: carboxypeptidase-like regulatory domain-containing protein, partial [Bacteroidetes bacterium]
MTRVSGKVVDAITNEPLPFVNIAFVGKSIGTVTDYNGEYNIETQWASNKFQASFIGYTSQVQQVAIGKNQVINIQLKPENIELNEIIVKSKKKRYRNKDNPAVELIKKVIETKDINRKEKLDYYEYDRYEKVEFDLNNITEKFRKKKAFNKFQFIFDYVDTSKVNGKPYLPVFLKETKSKVYYRKLPKTQKDYISGTNMIGFHDYIDNDGVSYLIDYLYEDIDIYDNTINLITNQFISPLSNISPLIYKFRIMDTVEVSGISCINLAFQPRNKLDFAFIGNLYIPNDNRFAIIKVDMRVTKDINLNFVNDLQIVQEFEYINDQCWMLTVDELTVDFTLGKKGTGMFGKKTVYYDNYLFNKKRPDTTYTGVENQIREDGYNERDDEFWENNRLSELSEQEQNIYTMVDSVQNVPAFKRAMDVVMLLVAGYWNFNKIDIGPVNTFYSFNDVEGFRLRVGGKTSDKFSKRLRLEGYLLYATKDEEFKYSGSATWSLNKKPLREFPGHSIMAMYQVETNFPGMELMFINEDNFLLSFKRGVADKILYYEMYKIEHYRDWSNGISTILNFRHIEQKPGGTLYFDYDDYSLDKIISSEITTTIRFAPNGKFYQGIKYRTPIITKYPIFQISNTQGIEGLFNADYT